MAKKKKKKKEKKKKKTRDRYNQAPLCPGSGGGSPGPCYRRTLGGGLPDIHVVAKGPPSQQSNALQKGQPVPSSFAHKACLQDSEMAVLHSRQSLLPPGSWDKGLTVESTFWSAQGARE